MNGHRFCGSQRRRSAPTKHPLAEAPAVQLVLSVQQVRGEFWRNLEIQDGASHLKPLELL